MSRLPPNTPRNPDGKFLPRGRTKEPQLPAARDTVLRDIFPELAQQPGADTNIRLTYRLKDTFPALYAKILLACTKSQVKLLKHLWGEPLGRSPYLEPTLKFLVEQGQFVDFLDLSSETAARQLVGMIAALRDSAPTPTALARRPHAQARQKS
jgi:hypothetical protein